MYEVQNQGRVTLFASATREVAEEMRRQIAREMYDEEAVENPDIEPFDDWDDGLQVVEQEEEDADIELASFENTLDELTAEVSLCDDGTLDTVVECTAYRQGEQIDNREIRYGDTSDYRDESGAFTEEGWEEFEEMVKDDYLEAIAQEGLVE